MTVITQDTAKRRYDQGLRSLRGIASRNRVAANRSTVLAIAAVMAYLAAYAYPRQGPLGVKKSMRRDLAFLQAKMDVEPVIEYAMRIAAIFRRPWSEPLPPTALSGLCPPATI